MVLKKKKKKGSKKKKKSPRSKSVGPDQDERDAAGVPDPGTLISGEKDAPGGKGKKKKVKKKKLTKAERAQAKLEKNMDKIRKEPDIFNNFVDRMDRWLRQIAPRAIAMFKKIDNEGEGIITYDMFKSGMFDLNIPLNKVELHLLATLLDSDLSGEIDYTELSEGLQCARDGENEFEEGDDDDEGEKEDDDDTQITKPPEKPKLIVTEKNVKTCYSCKMIINEPYRERNPRYLQIELHLVTFDKFRRHPGHVDILVHSHIPVFGLVQLIVQLTGIQSTKIAVFKDKTRSKEVRLPPHLTLEECGYLGRENKDQPEEIVLYYDYSVEFTDCPILICDHYFGQSFKVPVA